MSRIELLSHARLNIFEMSDRKKAVAIASTEPEPFQGDTNKEWTAIMRGKLPPMALGEVLKYSLKISCL
jgi:hypothetical protein